MKNSINVKNIITFHFGNPEYINKQRLKLYYILYSNKYIGENALCYTRIALKSKQKCYRKKYNKKLRSQNKKKVVMELALGLVLLLTAVVAVVIGIVLSIRNREANTASEPVTPGVQTISLGQDSSSGGRFGGSDGGDSLTTDPMDCCPADPVSGSAQLTIEQREFFESESPTPDCQWTGLFDGTKFDAVFDDVQSGVDGTYILSWGPEISESPQSEYNGFAVFSYADGGFVNQNDVVSCSSETTNFILDLASCGEEAGHTVGSLIDDEGTRSSDVSWTAVPGADGYIVAIVVSETATIGQNPPVGGYFPAGTLSTTIFSPINSDTNDDAVVVSSRVIAYKSCALQTEVGTAVWEPLLD